MKSSPLEEEMAAHLRGAGIDYVREFQFCKWRKWRADFLVKPKTSIRYYAWNGVGPWETDILVEIQGHGPQGRHGSWNHAESDAEKFSTAAALGWRVLPVTGKQVRSGLALRLIEAALGIRPLEPPPAKSRPARSQAARKPKRGKGLPDRVKKAAGLA